MKNKKVNLLGNGHRYVYVVARKLHNGDVITINDSGQPSNVGKNDWGFSSVYSTMYQAENALKEHIEISRQCNEKETYGILSIVNGNVVLLKSERA